MKNTNYNPFLYKQIKEQSDKFDEPLQLMIAGVFGAGKSTFLNTFIGEEILNSSKRAETAIITKLTYGEEKELIAHYKDGREAKLPMEWLSSLTSDRQGGGTALKPYVDLIEIRLPIEVLKYIHMVDSPGVNAKQEHNDISEGYFDNIDLAFWLLFYESPMNVVDREFVHKLKQRHVPVFSIINHVDGLMEAVDEEEEEDLQINLQRINQRAQVLTNNAFEDKIIGITASNALEAKLNGHEEDLELSNWEAIDNLLDEIKDDPSYKYKKQYHQLKELLQALHVSIAEREKYLPFEEYARFVDQFCQEEADTFHLQYEEKRAAVHEVENFLRDWEKVGGTPINSLSDLEELLAQLRECSSIYPHLPEEEIQEFHHTEQQITELIGKINDWEKNIEAWQAKKTNVKQERLALKVEWSNLINRKLTGIRRIKKFEAKDGDLREKSIQLHEEYERINQQKKDLYNQMLSFEESFSSFHEQIANLLVDNYQLLTTELTEYLSGFQKKYPSLSEETVEDMHRFTEDIQQLLMILNPSFTIDDPDIVSEEEYQAAYAEYDKIVSIGWTKRFTEENKQAFHLFAEAVASVGEDVFPDTVPGNLELDEQALLSLHVEEPTMEKLFDTRTQLWRLNRNRKRVFSSGIVAAVFIFLWQTNVLAGLFSSFEKEDAQADTEELSTYSDAPEEEETTPVEEIEEVESGAEPVEEEEAEPVFVPFEEVSAFMESYRDDYFTALNGKDFDYVSPYLEYGSQAYTALQDYVEKGLPEVYHFSNQAIEITSTSEVLEGTFHVETDETFTYEDEKGDLLHYQKEKTYTIRTDADSLSIIQIDTDNTEKTLEQLRTVELASEDQVRRFMQNFISEKEYAVYSGSANALQEYFHPSGSAWEEMEQYIEGAAIAGDQLEIVQMSVYSIQEEDARNYLADIDLQEKIFSMDGVTHIFDKQMQYRLAVDRYGNLTILDKTREDVLSEEEILPEAPAENENSPVPTEEEQMEIEDAPPEEETQEQLPEEEQPVSDEGGEV